MAFGALVVAVISAACRTGCYTLATFNVMALPARGPADTVVALFCFRYQPPPPPGLHAFILPPHTRMVPFVEWSGAPDVSPTYYLVITPYHLPTAFRPRSAPATWQRVAALPPWTRHTWTVGVRHFTERPWCPVGLVTLFTGLSSATILPYACTRRAATCYLVARTHCHSPPRSRLHAGCVCCGCSAGRLPRLLPYLPRIATATFLPLTYHCRHLPAAFYAAYLLHYPILPIPFTMPPTHTTYLPITYLPYLVLPAVPTGLRAIITNTCTAFAYLLPLPT